jgi:putative inorganic carbon (HCO3(-)) transporter
MASSTSYTSIKNTTLLIGALILGSIGVVFLSEKFGIIVNVLVLGVIAMSTIFYVSLRYPRYNIIMILGINFFMPLLIKAFNMHDIPFGIANEAICGMMLLTLTLNKRISGIKTYAGVALMIWLGYQIFELANPYATSRVAGFMYLRSLIPFFTIFFIAYSSMENKRDVRILLNSWMVFGLCAGLYGIYQELVGLPSYDYAWAAADEIRFNLLFTWGRMRKFSFFFNPSEFGMLMALTGTVSLVVLFFAKTLSMRALSAASALFCLWSMMYSGSRTAMIMLPVGMAIFTAITLNPKVMVAIVIMAMAGTVMILRPASGAMYVMATAFDAKNDPSMQVRLENRALIRAYIQSNPVGFGLGSTGYLGNKYTPGTFIGQFDTDSEYVRVAVESGWIGLILWSGIIIFIFSKGIALYFATREPDWKMNVTIFLVFFYMIMVAMYAQELFVSPLLGMLLATMIGICAKIYTKTNAGKLDEGEYEGS